jgi:hypothetical protein
MLIQQVEAEAAIIKRDKIVEIVNCFYDKKFYDQLCRGFHYQEYTHSLMSTLKDSLPLRLPEYKLCLGDLGHLGCVVRDGKALGLLDEDYSAV